MALRGPCGMWQGPLLRPSPGPHHRAAGRDSQRVPLGGHGRRRYLEVGAVVIVPVHNLRLPAVPDQHGDHLPPGQMRVELRGEDVDPRGRQGLRAGGSRAWPRPDWAGRAPLPQACASGSSSSRAGLAATGHCPCPSRCETLCACSAMSTGDPQGHTGDNKGHLGSQDPLAS